MKRIKVVPKQPNPLFELWLKEWKNEASAKNNPLEHQFAKALTSLRKYPLPLQSGKDCIILEHFGPKLCSMLDKKLMDHKERCTHSTEINKEVEKIMTPAKSPANVSLLDPSRTLLNCSSYAALLALYEHTSDSNYMGHMLEIELLKKMKKLYNRSLKIVGPGTYGDKAALSALLTHDLIIRENDPTRYSFTDRGVIIARKLSGVVEIDIKLLQTFDTLRDIEVFSDFSQIPNGIISRDDLCTVNSEDLSKQKSHLSSKNEELLPCASQNFQKTLKKGMPRVLSDSSDKVEKQIIFQPNTFDIILLVDTQETCGKKAKPQYDATISELNECRVPYEVHHLKVGDFTWIARCRYTKHELVLPYIVERKRIDDLSASITDGRFHEQKFRLKQSGIENLIYIVEKYGKNCRTAVPISSLMQASVNSLIQDDFIVQHTSDHTDTISYLSSMTGILKNIYQGKQLISCTKENLVSIDILSISIHLMKFEEFNKTASKQKNFKVREMFIRHLLQIKGVSVDKAHAITECYPTPQILITALNESNDQHMLANIQYGEKKRQIGPALSRTIWQLYSNDKLN